MNLQRLREPSAQEDQLAREVIGAAIEVHRELGPGFAETVYETALCIELNCRKVNYVRQAMIEISYKGESVGAGKLDLWVAGVLVVELKAVDALAPVHSAQVRAYLAATRCKLGLLINFNVSLLKQGIERIVNPNL